MTYHFKTKFGVSSKKFDAQELIIEQLNNSIKRLIDKSTELEKITEKDKTEILKLISRLSQAEKTIKTKHKAIQGQKKTISVLEEIIRQKESEIIRQNNLKWYQKLIGLMPAANSKLPDKSGFGASLTGK